MKKPLSRAALFCFIFTCCSSAIAQYSIDSAEGVSLLFSKEADGRCRSFLDAMGILEANKSIGLVEMNKSLGAEVTGGSGYKRVSISSLKSKSVKSQSKAPQDICGIGIEGEISDTTAEDFKWAFEHLKFNEAMMFLQLDSQGGLISAAMDIGNVLSQTEFDSVAWVPAGNQCSSACVLILAAASARYTSNKITKTQGKIGIHRPFDYEVSSLPSSYKQYLTRYDALMEEMKRYLRKFGVSPQLVDDMSVIPSDDIRYLTAEEQDKYGLGRKNIAKTEFTKAQQISRCGADYWRKRQAHFDARNRELERCEKLVNDMQMLPQQL